MSTARPEVQTSADTPRAVPPRTGGRGPGSGPGPWLFALLGVLLVVVVGFVIVAVRYHDSHSSIADVRATGVPPDISTSLANLMALAPVPSRPAPAFTLTDQHGRTLSLSSFRGHPIVLEFMDPRCTDICPLVSQEFVDAHRDLGKAGRGVVFLAINVNAYHRRVSDVAAFTSEHNLDSIPTWHFFTGPLAALRSAWARYGIAVQSRGPNADVIHSSIVFFIDRSGHERFIATPMDYHTKAGTAYIPGNQLASWGKGIALVARDLGA